MSVAEQRVVISKDTDFYYSHVLHNRPWKLLLVRTGNIRARELKELFERQLPAIAHALETNSLVEVSIRREGSRLVPEPLDIERDEKGWPRAFSELAGSAPDFDLGDSGGGPRASAIPSGWPTGGPGRT